MDPKAFENMAATNEPPPAGKPNGGPAFPRTAANPEWGLGTESFEGMSLRQWYAGMALMGWAAGRNDVTHSKGRSDPATIAKACFDYADAMIQQGTSPC
jgi:hypothetical protein